MKELECFKFLENADEEMERCANTSYLEKYEDKTTFQICADIVALIKDKMDVECDAYVIGPKIMCLSEGKPEAPIFLDIGQTRFFADRDYKQNINEIKRFKEILRQEPNWKVLRINYALPNISVIHLPTDYRCDLSVMNGFSVQISAMIGHFFEIQPEAIKFYHFIRNWLKINRVSFKQFTLVLLIINFLQEKNLMPSAKRAQSNLEQSYIDGVPVCFDVSKNICSYSVKKMVYYYAHVRDFFRYYSNFNFEDNVISTYYGYPIQKNEYEPKLDYDSPMCVAAFLNQKCNISRYVTENQVSKFMTVCYDSDKYLGDNNF